MHSQTTVYLSEKWNASYEEFMNKSAEENGTFALHQDIMTHCDEVIGLHLAERLSGEQGYSLLTAIVKNSLPFSYLNSASQYANFCADLLYHHAESSHFHKQQKMCLYSIPFKDSKTNFALDAIREMEHKDAVKGFRPRADASAVLPRMSIVDTFTENEEKRRSFLCDDDDECENSTSEDIHTWTVTDVDMMYITCRVAFE